MPSPRIGHLALSIPPSYSTMSMEEDTMTGKYYVSVVEGKRRGFLLGPYDTHAEAKANVARGRKLAVKADPWAEFYAFGTCRITALKVKAVFGL